MGDQREKVTVLRDAFGVGKEGERIAREIWPLLIQHWERHRATCLNVQDLDLLFSFDTRTRALLIFQRPEMELAPSVSAAEHNGHATKGDLIWLYLPAQNLCFAVIWPDSVRKVGAG